MTVHNYGIEPAELEVLDEPVKAAFLTDLGTLFDPPAVEHHDRYGEAAIACAPPSGRPVGPALLFKRSVTQEGDQALAWQGHVDILQAGEAKIAAFRQAARGMRIDMTAKWNRRAAFRRDCIAVEVADEGRQTRFGAIITSALIL